MMSIAPWRRPPPRTSSKESDNRSAVTPATGMIRPASLGLAGGLDATASPDAAPVAATGADAGAEPGTAWLNHSAPNTIHPAEVIVAVAAIVERRSASRMSGLEDDLGRGVDHLRQPRRIPVGQPHAAVALGAADGLRFGRT